jgi:hypothetical protein
LAVVGVVVVGQKMLLLQTQILGVEAAEQA